MKNVLKKIKNFYRIIILFNSLIIYTSNPYAQKYGYPIQTPRLLSSDTNLSKVVSTLHQFMRDWSVEGQDERNECYKPIIDAVLELCPIKNKSMYLYLNYRPPRVLCPGSGLCRLPFEFASLGYTAQVYIYFIK